MTVTSATERYSRRAAVLARHKLAAVALLAAGTGTAVTGTLSTFTGSGVRSETYGAGTFAFNLADPSTGAFTTNISGLAPGDFSDRLVNLLNPTGDLNYASVAISVSVTTSSLLNTDATNGLAVKIDDCSVAWTQATSASAATCSGTTTPLTASTALATFDSAGATYTSGLASLTNGGTDYLRFHYSFPTASTGTSGLTSTLAFTFTATQAAGGAYH